MQFQWIFKSVARDEAFGKIIKNVGREKPDCLNKFGLLQWNFDEFSSLWKDGGTWCGCQKIC